MDFKYTLGSIAAASICLALLVLTATAPTVGPAWQQTTSLGMSAGNGLVRLLFLLLAFLALQPILFGWKVMPRSDRWATILIVAMPLVLAFSPAPMLTTDGSLLRSNDPLGDMKLVWGAEQPDLEKDFSWFDGLEPLGIARRQGEEMGSYILGEVGLQAKAAHDTAKVAAEAATMAAEDAKRAAEAPDATDEAKVAAENSKNAAEAAAETLKANPEPALPPDPAIATLKQELIVLEGQLAKVEAENCDSKPIIRVAWLRRHVDTSQCERETAANKSSLTNAIDGIRTQIAAIWVEHARFQQQIVDVQVDKRREIDLAKKNLEILDSSVTWSRVTTLIVAIFGTIAVAFLSRGYWIALVVPVASVLVWHFPLSSVPGTTATLSWFSIAAGICVLEVFLIGALAVRLFVLSNLDFWSRMRRKEGLLLFAWTLGFWLPLGACILAATALERFITQEQINAIYSLPAPQQKLLRADFQGENFIDADSNGITDGYLEPKGICQEAAEAVTSDASTTENVAKFLIFTSNPYCGLPNLERDLKMSLRYWVNSAKERARVQIITTRDTIATTTEDVRKVAETAFENIVPQRIRQNDIGSGQKGLSEAFNLPSCRWYQLGCHIRRKINKAIDNAYVDRRARLKAAYTVKIDEALNKSNNDANAAVTVAETALPEALDSLESEVNRQALVAFRSSEVLSILARLLAIVAALKSFGFMLGRVAFADPNINRKISMGRGRGAAPSWKAVDISGDEGLILKQKGQFKVALGVNVDGTTQSGLWLHQPHKQTLKRLAPFRHLFQSFEHDPERLDVTLPCGNVNRIVSIRLEKRQRIGYFPKYLHGFSGNPKFGSHWSFRIGHMIQGRMRICTIEAPLDGECTIYLRSSEGAMVMRSDMTRSEGISPARLMAWSDGLDLDVNCRPGFAAIYTSSTLLKPFGEGFALFDGPTGKNRFGGAITFIPSLFLPL